MGEERIHGRSRADDLLQDQGYCARIDWGCTLDEHLQGDERETGRQMYIGIDASKGARES